MTLTKCSDRGAFDLAVEGWWADPSRHATWAKLASSTTPVSLAITLP
jgi:hypothetical protein